MPIIAAHIAKAKDQPPSSAMPKAPARDQQRRAVAPDIAGQAVALFTLGQGFDAIGVDRDVLAGREEGDHHRDRDRQGRVVQHGWSGQGEDGQRQHRLDHRQPSPPLAQAAKGRRRDMVEQRRPRILSE